jgi:hypothetical protein
MFSKSLNSGFTERHAKLEADTLLDFAVHCRQNKTQSKKSTRMKIMRVHSASMWQIGSVGLRKCDLAPPPQIFSHLGLTTVTVHSP